MLNDFLPDQVMRGVTTLLKADCAAAASIDRLNRQLAQRRHGRQVPSRGYQLVRLPFQSSAQHRERGDPLGSNDQPNGWEYATYLRAWWDCGPSGSGRRQLQPPQAAGTPTPGLWVACKMYILLITLFFLAGVASSRSTLRLRRTLSERRSNPFSALTVTRTTSTKT